MKTFEEPSRIIPVEDEFDVIVVGAGPAGVSAAVSAARQGVKTCIIEQCGCLGGVATAGLMSHWTGSTRGGIYEEILDRSCVDKSLRTTIDPDHLKWVLIEMLSEAGVVLKLYTLACEPIVSEGVVQGVITESKTGRQALMGRVVIDASGDGDIAARAGAEYQLGREGDGVMQPMTLMFKVGGVDTERAIFPGSFETTVEVPAGEIQSLARSNLPAPTGHVLLYRSTKPGVVTCNMTNVIQVDGTQATDLTLADVTCRRQIPQIVEFLRTYAPGYENCYLLETASMVGVRETRHFKGLYTLTAEDIASACSFPDWVVTKAYFNFDIHNTEGAGLDRQGEQKHFKQRKGYQIPYRCLVPEKVDGLLLAGRNISGTHKAHSNFRVMPICANMGQAAGVAAACAVQQGKLPRDLDVRDIQKILLTQGVIPE